MPGIVDQAERKRQEDVGHYLDDWKWILNGIIAPSKLGKYHVWCVICSCDGNALVSGVNVIRMHTIDLSWQCLNAKFVFICALTLCVGFCCRFYGFFSSRSYRYLLPRSTHTTYTHTNI